MNEVTYAVRVLAVEKRRNAQGVITSHRVLWRIEDRLEKKSFRTGAQADAYRSELLTAARRGEPFRLDTGLPVSWARRAAGATWYALTIAYVDAKWPYVSPNHRRGIAEALTDATEALLTEVGGPTLDCRRAALRWAYNTRVKDHGEVPTEHVQAVRWLEANTVRLDAFSDRATAAALARGVLVRISRTKDGGPAAANTANRKRMVINNAMEYAREVGLLDHNPLKLVKWTRPRTLVAVDPRVVINAEQARRFLAAVEAHSERGRRLKAFFGCMYYAALRPEEVAELRLSNLTLPSEAERWGEMRLTNAQPRSGTRWTNSGQPRERGPLKHRAIGDTRRVPVHPELVIMLREHIGRYVDGQPDARVFVGMHGGVVTDRTYLRVFHEARAAAFTSVEAASPLLEVPYSLRHAAVSTWLRTAGDPALVAEWAGHSVAVLLNVYAKCVDGAETETLDRILAATRSR